MGGSLVDSIRKQPEVKLFCVEFYMNRIEGDLNGPQKILQMNWNC